MPTRSPSSSAPRGDDRPPPSAWRRARSRSRRTCGARRLADMAGELATALGDGRRVPGVRRRRAPRPGGARRRPPAAEQVDRAEAVEPLPRSPRRQPPSRGGASWSSGWPRSAPGPGDAADGATSRLRSRRSLARVAAAEAGRARLADARHALSTHLTDTGRPARPCPHPRRHRRPPPDDDRGPRHRAGGRPQGGRRRPARCADRRRPARGGRDPGAHVTGLARRARGAGRRAGRPAPSHRRARPCPGRPRLRRRRRPPAPPSSRRATSRSWSGRSPPTPPRSPAWSRDWPSPASQSSPRTSRSTSTGAREACAAAERAAAEASPRGRARRVGARRRRADALEGVVAALRRAHGRPLGGGAGDPDGGPRGRVGRGQRPAATLATYVLIRRFEDVVAAANERLLVMSDGRFELVRSDEREDVRSQKHGSGDAGHRPPTARPAGPRTLSGGETFYVSLCLALGMADVVTAEAGRDRPRHPLRRRGLRVAGPGDARRRAGRARRLRAGGRVVGVVSHVEALKQSIADRIEVRRLPDGSSTLTVRAG